MTFKVHDMAELLEKREQRLQQLRSRVHRFEHKVDRMERYLKMFGACISDIRLRNLQRHLNDLRKAYREALEDYDDAINAQLSTFA